MIRDLRFDELERADRRRRLARLVIACTVLSSAVTFGVARELKIRKEFNEVPSATMGNLDSLRVRHDGIVAMLAEHHFWAGAYQARKELDDLVQSIHAEERTIATLEQKRLAEEALIREEAEVARTRGIMLAERRNFDAALTQLRRALELCDSLGDKAWNGGPWEYRARVLIDIEALESEIK